MSAERGTSKFEDEAVKDRLKGWGTQYIISDLDGTLIDTKAVFDKGISDACWYLIYADEASERARFDHKARELVGDATSNVFYRQLKSLRPAYGIQPVIMELALDATAREMGIARESLNYAMASNRLQGIYESDVPKVIHGSLKLIDTLNETGLPVLLGSHAEERWTDRKRRECGFYAKFSDTIYFDIWHTKAEQWEQKLAERNIDPVHLLVIGDNLKADILPPVALGARAILVDNGVNAHHHTPDFSTTIDEIVFKEKVIEVPRTDEVIDRIINY